MSILTGPACVLAGARSSGACRRSTARIRRISSRTLNGLVTKSSAPSSNPSTRSISSPRAVSIITGTCAVRGLVLSCLQISVPLTSGNMRSSRTRSGTRCSMRVRACSPSYATEGSNPACFSPNSSTLTMSGSSSTTRICGLAMSAVIADAGDGPVTGRQTDRGDQRRSPWTDGRRTLAGVRARSSREAEMNRLVLRGAAAGLLVLAACGRGQTSSSSFAYVGNNDLSSVSVFHIQQDSGMLTLLKTVDTPGGGATYCELAPSGRFLFVSGQFGNLLSTYTIDAVGMPTLLAGSAVPTGVNPHNLATDPSGRFLYVADTSSNPVTGFAVAASGTLTPVPGSPFPAGSTPYDVKVAASGKFAYAVNRDSEDVSAYAVDSATGALSPIAGQPFRIGCTRPPCGPRAIEFSPDGKFGFLPDRFSNQVSVLAVDVGTGALAAAPGSPFAAGQDPRSAAVDASGRHLYVANTVSNDVTAYSIDARTGALTQLSGSPWPAGAVPLGLEIDESGRYLYSANSGSNSVSIFHIDGSSGGLSPAGTVATPGSAFSITLK